MDIKGKIILVTVLIIIFNVSIKAQIIGFNSKPSNLSASFLFPKIEVEAKKNIFNILTVVNKSNKSFGGSIKISAPNDWQIIGQNDYPIEIEAHDSIKIPVRVLVSKNVQGEIGYTIVAAIYDKNDRQVFSEYSFVNIPRKPDTKVRMLQNISYFDHKTGIAEIQYEIQNNGNINELVHLEITSPEELTINQVISNESSPYVEELSLKPHTDTIVKFYFNADKVIDKRSFYKININTSTQDTAYRNYVWLNKVENHFGLIIPPYNKCAIIEINANNVFSDNDPSLSLLAMGTILFKGQTSLYYHFQNTNLKVNSSDFINDNTRAYIGVNSKYLDLRVGNIDNHLEHVSFGRGAESNFHLKNTSLKAFYIKGIYFDDLFYGGSFFKFFSKSKVSLKLGYGENTAKNIDVFSNIGLIGLNFPAIKKHSFSILMVGNKSTHYRYTPYDRIGYGIKATYAGKYKNLYVNINTDYGSPEFTGVSNGRFIINGNVNMILKNKMNLNLAYIKNDYFPAIYINDILQTYRFKNYNKYQVLLRKQYNRNVSISYGTEFLNESTNQLYISGNRELFSTQNLRGIISSKIRVPNSRIIISPKFDVGQIWVTEGPDLNNALNPKYYTFNAYLNINAKYSGLFIQYRNGPFGIYEQSYYYSINYFSKWLFIMPYYERFIVKDKLKLLLRANYQSNVNISQNNLIFTTQLTLALKGDWTLRALNTTATRTRKDAITNATLRYNTSYFEVGVRKEFNCPQPRLKYYNLKVVFFRDLNGDRVRNSNEPGINNILVNIKREYGDSIRNNNISDEFVSVELLSDPTGTIVYDNIPDGYYNIQYRLIGNITGNYSLATQEELVMMDDDKIVYVPYLENNKIIGKVIMNRDPLSSLPNIDLSNIRVIAEDTKGHSYSALTNKQGEFILYTPVADYYIVKVNNIFYESFDLQQPEFIVKFNGYKQFEVTFVFNEKKRKINFENELDIDDLKLDDIKVIRKTTLTGKIRDAISLEPVEAEIKIINNKNNKVVSRAISNKLNGNYNISYAAGTHFRIEVISKGYWEHVENLYIEQVISIQNINKDIMLNKEGANREEEQKTFIIYNKKENEFKENFKQGQQIPINYLNFNLKETRLDPKAKPELDRLIDLLNKNITVSVEIAGYSDDGGNARVEKMMAKRRADAVKKYLTDHGLSGNRVSVKSYGNSRPLIPGKSEKAKAKNRRVEIIVR